MNKDRFMKEFKISSLLLSLSILMMLVISCGKTNVWEEPPDTPVIDSIAPAKGKIGTQIRLYGTGFSYHAGENFVKVNGITVRVDSPSTSTVVLATITSVTGTGHVHIAVNNKEADGPIFTYDTAAVSINSLTPSFGWVDTIVKIRGVGFGTIPDSVKVFFNSKPAVIIQFSDTLIVVKAPDALNQTQGTASVTVVVHGTTSNALPFVYQHKPVITGVINDQWNSGFYYWIAVTGLSSQTANDKISVNGNPVAIDTILRLGTPEYNQQPVGEKIVVKRSVVDPFLIDEAADFLVTVNGQPGDVYHFQNKPQITNITAPNRPAFTFAAGDTATVTGLYFGNQQTGSLVEIWRTVALTPNPVILSWTHTQIKIIIPAYSQPNGTSMILYVRHGSNAGQADVVYQSAIVVNPGHVFVLGSTATTYYYWIDGTAHTIPNCTEAVDMHIAGQDVYIAGETKEPVTNKLFASYWKNGVVTDLTDATTSQFSSRSNAVFVDGSDVYVAGMGYIPPAQHSVAMYWKNGVRVNLTDGANDSQATDIVVSGNDVYVCGYENMYVNGTPNGHNVVAYWKNGVRTNCTDGSLDAGTGKGSCIAVSGGDVYIAGEVLYGFTFPNIYHMAACYWKNGVQINLTDPVDYAYATSIDVAGADIHVAGQMYVVSGANTYAVATYWKNGALTNLTNIPGVGLANSVFVAGNDVYVAGTRNTVSEGGYWKNTAFTPVNAAITAYKVIVQ
jgi:hypothetical protein